MNSALSIASVTAILKDLLDNRLVQQGIAGSMGDITVSALPPDRVPVGAEEQPQINLFLYRVVPNTTWRTSDRVAGGENGSGTPSSMALDLHYLLTAYGQMDLQAEILLGQSIQLMHETPVLSAEHIRASLDPSVSNGLAAMPTRSILKTSSLLEATEQIRIQPEFIDLDETSKLWSALQARYRPSVAYRVSLVEIRDSV
jgi:hypothetical protein